MNSRGGPRSGKRLKVPRELQSLVTEKMINEPHKTNADLGRELGVGMSTMQSWATKDPRVQLARTEHKDKAQKELGKEVERLMKNHKTFAEAKKIIRKEALDDGQRVPGSRQIIRALESHLGRNKAKKFIGRRDQERRESMLEAVNAWLNGMRFEEVCRQYLIAKSTLYWRLEKMEKPKELQARVNARLPKISRNLSPTTQAEQMKFSSDSIFKPGRSELINQITNNFDGQAAIVELARKRDDTHWYVPPNDLQLTAKHLTGGQETFESSVDDFIQTSSDNGKISWIDVFWVTGKKRKHPFAAFEIDISGERTNALTRFADLSKANPCINVKVIIVVKPEHLNRTIAEVNRPCFEDLDVIVSTTDRVLEALRMPHVGRWEYKHLFAFLDVQNYDEKAS